VIVEMLHTESCPNAEVYLPRLRRLVTDAGVADPVRVRVVANGEQAQHERFLGSPTVRVDGRDVDPGAATRQDYSLSCRLYVGPSGVSGMPPDEWVLALLRVDRSGGWNPTAGGTQAPRER
jgi:hypothetical protein